jgi:hypothetical protein
VDQTIVDLNTAAAEPRPDAEPSERLLRLRIATASRATLLREAHTRLQDDLSDLRSKARR